MYTRSYTQPLFGVQFGHCNNNSGCPVTAVLPNLPQGAGIAPSELRESRAVRGLLAAGPSSTPSTELSPPGLREHGSDCPGAVPLHRNSSSFSPIPFQSEHHFFIHFPPFRKRHTSNHTVRPHRPEIRPKHPSHFYPRNSYQNLAIMGQFTTVTASKPHRESHLRCSTHLAEQKARRPSPRPLWCEQRVCTLFPCGAH